MYSAAGQGLGDREDDEVAAHRAGRVAACLWKNKQERGEPPLVKARAAHSSGGIAGLGSPVRSTGYVILSTAIPRRRLPVSDSAFTALREQMLAEIVQHTRAAAATTRREILDARVLAAMGRVHRHDFVPVEMRAFAYADAPLPIGQGKTISQPFMVALMVDLLEIRVQDRVLEVGTGLGYQAAVLAELAGEVYTIEIVPELAMQAGPRLAGLANVTLRTGNGYLGWPEGAPFDRIIAAAAPDLIPPTLLNQLRPGGRMVIPAGLAEAQKLLLVSKDEAGKADAREVLAVRFAEMETGDVDVPAAPSGRLT